MSPPLLHLRDIHLTHGGTPLLTGAELMVSAGERACLVGRNGSGKSTLLKIAAGLIEPDRGERFQKPDATVRYLTQEPDLSGFDSTLDFAQSALGPSDDDHRPLQILNGLGLTGAEDPATLSGGEARRAALARVLAPQPDVLLLDEPTNHLDLPAIEWLEGELAGFRGALVLISHDRRFLERLSRATVWLDRGTTRRLDQGFSAFEAWRDRTLEEEERELHRLDRKISAEEDWLRYGVTARRKRNVRRLDELSELRRRRREHRKAEGTAAMAASEAERSGRLVIEAKRLSKAFGETKVVNDLTLEVTRGERIGVVGANGAGKTTLLRLITGRLEPDTGSVKLGTRLEMVELDQRRESLDPGATLAHVLTDGAGDQVMVGGQPRHVVGYMKDFLFRPEQARTSVDALSGGERGRLMLARAFARPSNLMVLDEPTNDLDLETLDLLEELVAGYGGTVLLVSHDRDFLDRVATSVLVAEGDGRWNDYAGGYTDMVAQRGGGIGARASVEKPKRQGRDAPAGPAPARRKLSFKDKHALETLPGEIAKLETTVTRLESELADPQLFSHDPKRFAQLAAELDTARHKLSGAEESWLELEMLREEIEG